ncbi:DUF2971 domain-containing protein [Paraburkholderia sp. J67]|uniref:DUF2971 domain-containing protein n=1 Tax=Paraburkholderia sp. J67 TaxID=2805435 RepID=UPI002ABDA94F|nr:DUF2971 domain-containing protein [Paraburkholderia sp. J67]
MAIIYHYCNPGAFLSIVESHSLWLGNARKMFDARIGDAVGTMLVNALAQGHQPCDGQHTLASELALALNLSQRELFTCCFSGNRDATAQWWSYADAGRGFAIGFDSDLLHPPGDATRARQNADALADSARGIALTPVLYGDDATLSRHIETLKNRLAQAALTCASASGSANQARCAHVRAVALACEWLGVVSKDPSFRHELEWRLVYVSSSDADSDARAPQIHWRTTNHGLTSYFRFGFPPEAVREVWIGPHNSERLPPGSLMGVKEHHALKLLMRTHGYERTEIIEACARHAM